MCKFVCSAVVTMLLTGARVEEWCVRVSEHAYHVWVLMCLYSFDGLGSSFQPYAQPQPNSNPNPSLDLYVPAQKTTKNLESIHLHNLMKIPLLRYLVVRTPVEMLR